MSRGLLFVASAAVGGGGVMKGGAEKEKAPPSNGVTLARHNSEKRLPRQIAAVQTSAPERGDNLSRCSFARK